MSGPFLGLTGQQVALLHHEAGHAIALEALGYTVEAIDIEMDPDPWVVGRGEVRAATDVNDDDWRLVAMCGPAATLAYEARHVAYPETLGGLLGVSEWRDGWRSDLTWAIEMLPQDDDDDGDVMRSFPPEVLAVARAADRFVADRWDEIAGLASKLSERRHEHHRGRR